MGHTDKNSDEKSEIVKNKIYNSIFMEDIYIFLKALTRERERTKKNKDSKSRNFNRYPGELKSLKTIENCFVNNKAREKLKDIIYTGRSI